jgi:hypothetical protein
MEFIDLIYKKTYHIAIIYLNKLLNNVKSDNPRDEIDYK